MGRWAGTVSVGKLGQEPIDRLVEAHDALLEQDHRRHGGDRLGHRRDAEDRVAPHRTATINGGHADHIDVCLAPPAHDRDDAGRGATVDVARQDVVEAGEAVLGES